MYTFIFDIGKTNIKGCVLDECGLPVWSRAAPNQSLNGDYLHFDTEAIWCWLLEALKAAAADFEIAAINISTHGASAALVGDNGTLVFSVMDYEFEGLELDTQGYDDLRPAFDRTLSPKLAFGLNLGRQLWWLKASFPDRFAQVSSILMYPQYWAWRLCGIAATELTSLGCHTDLWEPASGNFSSLVERLGIEQHFPQVVSACKPLGSVQPAIAELAQLPAGCLVYPGVHDSNASFARHLYAGLNDQFTVISSGTWIVSMSNGGDISRLDERRDMLANVSVLNQPVVCARYMGGREFDVICHLGDGTVEPVGEADVSALIDAGVFALPPFERGSGPFRHAETAGRLVEGDGSASLATLYTALMIDYELELLGATGDIIFGGIAQKNPTLCALLAQLRPSQKLYSCDDVASTIAGAWCLTRWDMPAPAAMRQYVRIGAADVPQLMRYREEWRCLAAV